MSRAPARRDAAERAAIAAASLSGSMAAMQVALAAGAPLGEHVWGGTQPARLPPAMRVASGAAAGGLVWVSAVVLARAGVTGRAPVPRRHLGGVTWAIAGAFALNTAGNLASKTAVERWGFGALTAALTTLTVVVARSPRPA